MAGNKKLEIGSKESFGPSEVSENQGKENSSELNENVWKQVMDRDDLNSSIKLSYHDRSVVENLGKSQEEVSQKPAASVSTATSPRTIDNPSIGTQTACDVEDRFKEKEKPPIPHPGGDNSGNVHLLRDSAINIEHKLSRFTRKPLPPLPEYKEDQEQSCEGVNVKQSQLFCNKTDPRSNPNLSTIVFPSDKRELNVYSVHTPELMDIFKTADWFKYKSQLLMNSSPLYKKEDVMDLGEKLNALSFTNDSVFQSKLHFKNKEKNSEDSSEHVQGFSTNTVQSDSTENTNHTRSNKKNSFDQTSQRESHIFMNSDQDKVKSVASGSKHSKEHSETLDTALCVEIIKKLTDTMMKCEPGKVSNDLSSGKCYMYLDQMKKLRTDHLKHIQREVKHIEELDKFLAKYGVIAQLVYTVKPESSTSINSNP